MEETNRQRKIAGVLQQDLVDVLQRAAQDGMKGVIISVSKVSVTADLGVAKVYLSVFPSEKRDEIIEGVKSNTPLIRHELAQRTKINYEECQNCCSLEMIVWIILRILISL